MIIVQREIGKPLNSDSSRPVDAHPRHFNFYQPYGYVYSDLIMILPVRRLWLKALEIHVFLFG